MHFLKVKTLCAVMIPMFQLAFGQHPQPYSRISSDSKVRLEDVERDTYKNQEDAYSAQGGAEQLQQYNALSQSSAYGPQSQAPSLYSTQNAPTSPLFSPQYQYILQPYIANQNQQLGLSFDAAALQQQVPYVPNTGSSPFYRPVYVPQSHTPQGGYIASNNPSDYYKTSSGNPSDYYKTSTGNNPSDYYKNTQSSSAYSHKGAPVTALKIISSPQHIPQAVPQSQTQPQYILQPQYYQPIAYTQPQSSPYLFNTVYQTQHTGKNIYSSGIKSTTPAAPIKEREEPFLPIGGGGASRYEYSQNEVPTSFTKFRLSG